MTELNIENSNEKISIVISKSNCIIFDNMINILNFYKNLDEVINEKNETINIYFDNKKINSRDSILINLMDVDNIINSIKYQKNSLLYEYVTSIINDWDFKINQEVNEYLENKFIEISKSFCFNSHVTFESDLNKIFNTGIQIKPKIKLDELNIKINELMNYIISFKQNKTFIIFYNSDFINYKSDFDNVYLFDISQKNKFFNYNLLCLSEISNFEQEILVDKLKLNWPISYNENEIENLLNSFLLEYFKLNKIETYDKNTLIVSKLLNKFYNLDKEIITDLSSLDNIIKSFLLNN